MGTVVGTSAPAPAQQPGSDQPDVLTLLAEGAHYVVLESRDFLKVAVDSDLEGYVFKDHANTTVEFQKAVSVE